MNLKQLKFEDVGNKANETTLLVSRPPIFVFSCGRAVIIHYLLFNILAFWGCGFLEPPN